MVSKTFCNIFVSQKAFCIDDSIYIEPSYNILTPTDLWIILAAFRFAKEEKIQNINLFTIDDIKVRLNHNSMFLHELYPYFVDINYVTLSAETIQEKLNIVKNTLCAGEANNQDQFLKCQKEIADKLTYRRLNQLKKGIA